MARLVSFALLICIVVFLAGAFVVLMKQFLLPMFLALLLVVMFQPLHEWMLDRFKGRRPLSAGLTTLVIGLIVLLPMGWFTYQAVSEGVAVARTINRDSATAGVERIDHWVEEARQRADRVGLTIPTRPEMVHAAIDFMQNTMAPAALRTTQFLLDFGLGLGIMVVSLYFFLADGPSMIRALMLLTPMDNRYLRQLFEQFTVVSRSIVLATLLSALAQGVLTGIALYFAGLPAVVLLTAVTALLSLVPFVGAGAVWLPASAYLYLHDDRAGAAIFVALWGLIVVSLADNIVKPWVLHGRSNMHPLLALLSVLGGISALGIIGIFVGPMVVAFLHSFLGILQTEIQAMELRGGAGKTLAAAAASTEETPTNPARVVVPG